jgi:hypothetical protein
MAVRLSALCASCCFAPQKHYFSASGPHFCSRLSITQGLVWLERLGKLIEATHLIRSQTWDFPTISILTLPLCLCVPPPPPVNNYINCASHIWIPLFFHSFGRKCFTYFILPCISIALSLIILSAMNYGIIIWMTTTITKRERVVIYGIWFHTLLSILFLFFFHSLWNYSIKVNGTNATRWAYYSILLALY